MDIASAALRLLIISAKVAFISISVFAFVFVIGLIATTIMIALNFSVLGDIHSLVQMWLPFNLNVVILWLLTLTTAFILYRLSLIAIQYLNAWLNQ